MVFRPCLIKDLQTNQLTFQNKTLCRAEGAPLIDTPEHRPLPGKPAGTVLGHGSHWPRVTLATCYAAVWCTPGSLVEPLSRNNCMMVPGDHEVTQTHGKYKSPFVIHDFIKKQNEAI